MNTFKPYFAIMMLILVFFSCSAHKRTIPAYHHPPPVQRTPVQTSDPCPQHNNSWHKRKIILKNAIECLGLPYKWGGRSPVDGFDCSGLIVYTHQKAGIALPRTAAEQFNKGKPVAIKNLQIADLVFFKPPKGNKAFHVGIYSGDGRFIHAPGKGRHICYGRLRNPYFKRHYIGSRRYL